MTDLAITEAFKSEYGQGYRDLVKLVLKTCEGVRNATSGLIYREYSRAEKQKDELKDASKILEKIIPPVTVQKLRQLHDIIGVTVVVYYPDDAMLVFEKMREALESHSVRVTWGPEQYDKGYYAIHAALRSTKGSHSGLLCELQIKTVLHDAWSAKMHDLTYKPIGTIDDRLKGLMEAVSSQIQGIEQQSITIRNIVQGRQKLEARAFQTLCDSMFSTILQVNETQNLIKKNPIARSLWQRIEQLRKDTVAGHADIIELQKIIDEIDRDFEKDPLIRIGWLLLAKLGSGLLFGDLTSDLVTQVDRFLGFVVNDKKAKIEGEVLLNVPNAFYVLGDLRRAAQYSDRLREGALGKRLGPESRLGLYFNGVTYLLELEHIKPMRSAHLREDLRKRVEIALNDKRIARTPSMASPLMDSRGLYKIVFGTTPTEIREGINLCTKSAEMAGEWEKPVADACLDWRLESGWLRYFDVVNSTKN